MPLRGLRSGLRGSRRARRTGRSRRGYGGHRQEPEGEKQRKRENGMIRERDGEEIQTIVKERRFSFDSIFQRSQTKEFQDETKKSC